jgi:hypothetical protein
LRNERCPRDWPAADYAGSFAIHPVLKHAIRGAIAIVVALALLWYFHFF